MIDTAELASSGWRSTELESLGERIEDICNEGVISDSVIPLIETGFKLLNHDYQCAIFDFLLSIYYSNSTEYQMKVKTAVILKKISFSQSFIQNPIIREDAFNFVLDAFSNITEELANISLDFISQQVLFSSNLYQMIYSSLMLSEYFVTIADSVNLSSFILALSKYCPPASEGQAMGTWCVQVFEKKVKGSVTVAMQVMSNLIRFGHVVEIPTNSLEIIYKCVESEYAPIRESALRLIFYANIPFDSLIPKILQMLTQQVSLEGLRLITKYGADISEQSPKDLAQVLFIISQNYPHEYSKIAFLLIFELGLQSQIKPTDMVNQIFHFIEDEDTEENFAELIVALIFSDEASEFLPEIYEIMQGFSDEISKLAQSPNDKISKYGSILEEFIDIKDE